MPKVTIEFTESEEDGRVSVTANFDPPILPGVELPITHRTALDVLRGTRLQPIMEAAIAAGAA